MLDARPGAAAQSQAAYAEFLADLLGHEVAVRRDHYLIIRTRLAHLPFHRTLERSGFAFQPSTD